MTDTNRYIDMARYAEAAEDHARQLFILLVQLEAMDQLHHGAVRCDFETIRSELETVEKVLIRLHGYALGKGGEE